MNDDHVVKIAGDVRDDDGWTTDLGELPRDTAWWEVPLPSCPDCGGAMQWAEAGGVPGTRQCAGCGSMFNVRCERGRVTVVRERYH